MHFRMAFLSIHLLKSISMRTTFLVFLAVVMTTVACNKDNKDSMVSEISGKVVVWGLGTVADFSVNNPPRVELYQMKTLVTNDPWSPDVPYKVPLALAVLNTEGEYSFSIELEKDGQYFVEVLNFDTAMYMVSKPVAVGYKDQQTVNAEVVAKAWATPRFVNPSYQPGDTFLYLFGIGGNFSAPPAITSGDTTMGWVHATWGGSDYGTNSREVRGQRIRQGVVTDTVIMYSIAPGATAVVDINW
jgi:hypothetical protein